MAATTGWIKWDKGLTSKREVCAIAAKLSLSRREVACCCMLVWEWADGETADGKIDGVVPEFIDDLTGHPGFAKAMRAVGWLEVDDTGIFFPSFSKHNGCSAKARAQGLARQRKHRERE